MLASSCPKLLLVFSHHVSKEAPLGDAHDRTVPKARRHGQPSLSRQHCPFSCLGPICVGCQRRPLRSRTGYHLNRIVPTSNFVELKNRLSYIRNLNFNAIELLPISNFQADTAGGAGKAMDPPTCLRRKTYTRPAPTRRWRNSSNSSMRPTASA